jgi:hypothetical protein
MLTVWLTISFVIIIAVLPVRRSWKDSKCSKPKRRNSMRSGGSNTSECLRAGSLTAMEARRRST